VDVYWLPVLMGIPTIGIGLLIIKFRRGLFAIIVEGQSVMFGRRVAQFQAKHSNSSALLYPGIGAILMGVAMILLGLFAPREMF